MDAVAFHSPTTIHKPQGYSHIAIVTGPHRTIEIAGQVGLSSDGSLPEVFETQVMQAFKNLKACLDAAAGSPTIVKLRYYVKNYQYPSSLAAITSAKKILFGDDDTLPPSVLVSVSELGHPKLLFEVEATAVAPLE
ncbi:YjgF-like protein [Aspergillus nidulans var. acristatus]